MLTLILISIPLLILESGILFLFLNQTIDPLLLIYSHLMITAALGLYAYYRVRVGKRAHFHILLCLTTGILGPLGILGTLFSILLYSYFKGSLPPILESYDSLFPNVGKTEVEKLFEQLHFGNLEQYNNDSVVPFIDILNYGDQRQKQALIVLLINNYHSKFSPVLKQALNDEDNSLRVLAAMGIAQIENDFMKRTLEIEKNTSLNSNDPEHWKTLGQHYDNYAYSGILDKVRESKYREMAITAYKEYLQFNPGDPNIVFNLGRTLLRNGNTLEASNCFEDSINKGIQSPAILFWYFESLYRLHQYHKLRTAIQSHYDQMSKIQNDIPLDLLNVLKIWIRPQPNLNVESKQVAA